MTNSDSVAWVALGDETHKRKEGAIPYFSSSHPPLLLTPLAPTTVKSINMFSSSTDANKTHPSATSGSSSPPSPASPWSLSDASLLPGSTFPASQDPLARSTNIGAPLGATTGDQTHNHGHSGASLDHNPAGTLLSFRALLLWNALN